MARTARWCGQIVRGRHLLIAAVLAGPFMSGCAFLRALDFGGDPGQAFEFHWGWDRGIQSGSGKPGQIDPGGVYTPEDPAAEALFSFPAIHGGIALEVKPEPRMTPTVGIEIFRIKVPWARWWIVQAGAGSQLAEIYIGKRVVALIDVTVGPWVGWDFEGRRRAWGIAATMVKF